MPALLLPLDLHVLTPAVHTERNALLALPSVRNFSPHHISVENAFVNTESRLLIAGGFVGGFFCCYFLIHKPCKPGNVEGTGFNLFFSDGPS